MVARAALSEDEMLHLSRRGTARPTHPLKAWRMTRQTVDHKTKAARPMTIADAARSFSAFTGRDVSYQTWMAWERYEDEPAFRRPNDFYMKQLFLFTRGAFRPDHSYPIDEWRKELDEAVRLAALAGGAAAGAPKPADERRERRPSVHLHEARGAQEGALRQAQDGG